MNDAGTFLLTDFFPLDHAMDVACLGLCVKIVERAAVSPSEHVCALDAIEDFVFSVEDVDSVSA